MLDAHGHGAVLSGVDGLDAQGHGALLGGLGTQGRDTVLGGCHKWI
jgi:hypothetical protein